MNDKPLPGVEEMRNVLLASSGDENSEAWEEKIRSLGEEEVRALYEKSLHSKSPSTQNDSEE
jgi:hypothetical protein